MALKPLTIICWFAIITYARSRGPVRSWSLKDRDADACLNAHNLLRSLHPDTEPLEWDAGLANDARTWCDHLLKNNMFDHDYAGNRRRKQGENLYTMFGPAEMTCAHAVEDWYNEVRDYDFQRGKAKNSWKTLIEAKDNNDTVVAKRGRSGKMIGHFTQIVWKNTKRVGAAISCRKEKKEYEIQYHKCIVCARYKEPGNYNNEYIENVSGPPPVDIPELHELDPRACKNSLAESKCKSLANQFQCESTAWRCFMLAGCYKFCQKC